MNCCYCGEPVNAQDDYRRIEGWERKGRSGGGSDIVLRQPWCSQGLRPKTAQDEWSCAGCIQKLKWGLSVEQGALPF